jgi:hypothetical protein
MPTQEDIAYALAELRRAGYSASQHPDKHGYLVVNDPVHVCAAKGMLEQSGYEHRTIHIDHVFRFIDDRS